MSLLKEGIQREDMYFLASEGLSVDSKIIEGKRMGKLDGPHLFFEGGGEVLPSSLLKARNNRKINYFRSQTFKLGFTHSHDSDHRLHIFESVANPPTTVRTRFRKRVKEFRSTRRASRDR